MRSWFLFFLLLCSATSVYAQREQQIQPVSSDDAPYSRKFFLQLRGVFGRFRETDLERAFERAQPIQCSELINGNGDWRTVAFFNEKRELGDWYRSSLEEVKTDLSAFIFKGVCRGEHGPVQLTTKFPVSETVEAYNRGRITLDQVDVNVNTAVRAEFDPQTNAYTFELPYLFLVSRQDDQSLYSLAPPTLVDRARYATDVIDHWGCKSITAENVTYQFLICRTTTLPRNPRERTRTAPFGASAYFILSDGQEASSSVKLSFGDAGDKTVEDQSVRVPEPEPARGEWESPDSDEKLLDIARDEFRIRFNSQTWTGRLTAAQVLSGKQISNLASANPPAGADYCVWLPGAGGAANRLLSEDLSVAYGVSAHDQDGQSATWIKFDLAANGSVHFGALQCFFPRMTAAPAVPFSRWASAVGTHLVLEVRP